MSARIFVAFSGLIALAASVSGAGVVLPMEGASTMTKLVAGPEFKAAVAPTVVAYGGSGTGAGRTWVLNGDNTATVMAFGDGAFAAPLTNIPPNVADVPIAYGSIALYYNLPAIPNNACLSFLKQCQLFNALWRPKITTWSTLLGGLPAAIGNIKVRVVVRSDSSGSTLAVKRTYELICRKFFPTPAFPVPFKFGIDTSTAPPTLAPGYVGFEQTSGVVAAIQAITGSVGYAGCGQTRTAKLIELPLTNVRNVCTLCRNCPVNPNVGAPYGPNIKCGNYGAFRVADPKFICAWQDVIVNGDKDRDGDIFGVDFDNDNDGTQPNDFPIVFAEFIYFNTRNRLPICNVARTIAKKMISTRLTPIYPKYAFVPLPLSMRRVACKCIRGLCGGQPPITGVLTAAGDCL